jgi:hypothetical protein
MHTSMYKYRLRKPNFINFYVIIIISFLLLLILTLHAFHKAIALSPRFQIQETNNEDHKLNLIYGNSEAMKDIARESNYTDMLAVDYLSNGKTLDATFWFKGLTPDLASIYNEPFRKVAYGMLIDADPDGKTGYNAADYDYYVLAADGKFTAYLYQLSLTGGYRLLNHTEVSFNSTGPNYVHLSLDLSSINYPSKYDVLFYTAESFKSNEVREYTDWVNIPPPKIYMTTLSSNILIRQGEEQLIPARVVSSSGFPIESVINVTVNNMHVGFNSSEVHVTAQRTQPPLFKIDVPQQTALGTYTVPLIVKIREPSVATITKPISSNLRGGMVDRAQLSKKYPTSGSITLPVNLTITVIPPSTMSDQFKDFWGIYGQFIGIFAGGFVGAASVEVLNMRKKKNKKEDK